MDDKLLILEDTNGDGKADKSTVFAGDLNNPTGFEFWNGGVLVAQQPNLVFLKDTNGDDKYDTKEILLHGFDSADTHHAINSFTFDRRRRALHAGRRLPPHVRSNRRGGRSTRQADGGVYRFEPRTWKFETYIPFNFPNPHGHVFDQWGRDIVFDATGGQPYYGPSFSTKKYFPAMETKQAPKPGDVRTRPVGGAEILSSRHFPEAMQGNLIVLNTIGFRGLLNYKLSEDGAGLKIDRGRADPQLGRRELPPGRRRGRPRRRAVLRRLAQPDHRPHAAQPARHARATRCTAASIASPPWAGRCSSRPDRRRSRSRSCSTCSRSRRTASAIAPRSS